MIGLQLLYAAVQFITVRKLPTMMQALSLDGNIVL